ncbi:hypothetical protein [Cedecea neteri]|uniref:hypothetical protein n=1 Tax=Cedecea neteri TaxID=158822 RepID=UPI0004F6CA1C|nr:hypothetical protein [Cedecea neteri]AIR66896.1 hypothetical protein LH86_17935 [Cedecea neteri]
MIEMEAEKDRQVMAVQVAIQTETEEVGIYRALHIICRTKEVVVGPMDLEIQAQPQIRLDMVVAEVAHLLTAANTLMNKKLILLVCARNCN